MRFPRTAIAALVGFSLAVPDALALPPVDLEGRAAVSGRVVDTQGAGVGGRQVTFTRGGQAVARATSGARGDFTVARVPPGTYLVRAGGADGPVVICRVWAPGTAPPSARQGLLVVVGEDVVRGQQFPIGTPRYTLGFYATALAIAGGVVAIRLSQKTSS